MDKVPESSAGTGNRSHRTRIAPYYFEEIEQYAIEEWRNLEASSWKRTVDLLFAQVQNPRHVLSELLQNADDAGATWARAWIDTDQFIFEHGGSDFSAEQFKALCSFGLSAKSRLRTIGFRGIGFKSTFSYGPVVQVFTPTLACEFHKERYTVPVWIGDAPDIGHTRIQVQFESHDIRERAVEDIAFWVDNPTPLIFFEHIRMLEFNSTSIELEEHQSGLTTNSSWVDIRIGDRCRRVLHAVSAELQIPEVALDEIRTERNIGGMDDLNITTCRVEVVLGDPRGSQIYVVLPTTAEISLPFSVNAPFIQDPSRQAIKDVGNSPMNRWLLDCVGDLTAMTMIAWLKREDLPIEERAKAYAFLTNQDIIANASHTDSARQIMSAFWNALDRMPVLLSATGHLSETGDCLAIDQEITDVWSTEETLQYLGTMESQLLSVHVSAQYRQALGSWGLIAERSTIDVIDSLASHELMPRPNNAKLAKLWAYLGRSVHSPGMRAEVQEKLYQLPIVPALHDDALWRAQSTITLDSSLNLTPEVTAFVCRHLAIYDVDWFLGNLEGHGTNKLFDPVTPFRQMERALGLRSATPKAELAQRLAGEIFMTEDPQDQGVTLAHILASLDAPITTGFKFRVQNGEWKDVSCHLLAGQNMGVETLLPDSYLQAAAIDNEYFSRISAHERRNFTSWLRSSTPVTTFPVPIECSHNIRGITNLKRFVRQRGGNTNFELLRKSESFVVSDYDFPAELWSYWGERAAAVPTIWSDITSNILQDAFVDYSQSTIRQSTRTREYPVSHGPLISRWIERLADLPCVSDDRGCLSRPAELLRSVQETIFLQGVDRFVSLDLDLPANTWFLDMLGVRTDPTTSDEPLRQLRAISESATPSIVTIAALFKVLDQISARQSPAQLEELREVFKGEQLILSGDGRWLSSDLLVQQNQSGITGTVEIHPELRALDLSIWDRLQVPRQPSKEKLLDWLTDLPTGYRLSEDQARQARQILQAFPEEAWKSTNCWITLNGLWEHRNVLHWWSDSGALASSLFPAFKSQTIDASMLAPDIRRNDLFEGLESIEAHTVERVDQHPTDVTTHPLPEWLDVLVRGLKHLIEQRIRHHAEHDASKEEAIYVRDLENAKRLSAMSWARLSQLNVVPYLNGVPVGAPQKPRAAWVADQLYVSGTSVQYHDDLVRTLTQKFARKDIRDVIVACASRDPKWIDDYFYDHFDFRPTRVAFSQGAGSQSHVDTIDSRHLDLEEPARVVISVKEDVDTQVRPRTTAGQAHALPTWWQVIATFLERRGFVPQMKSQHKAMSFFHPDDGRTVALDVGPFHAVERGASYNLIANYWVAQQPLAKGIEVPAEVWAALDADQEAGHILVAQEHQDVYDCYPILQFREMIEIFPATYRLTIRR